MWLPHRNRRNKSRKHSKPGRRTRLGIEALEQRVVPATTPDVVVRGEKGHRLQLIGTEQKDGIDLAPDSKGIRVTCNGHAPQVFAGIDQLSLLSRGGDDVVSVSCAPGTLRSALIDVGNGHDD